MFNKNKDKNSFGKTLLKTGVATAGIGGLSFAAWRNRKKLTNLFKPKPIKNTQPFKTQVKTNPVEDAYKYFGLDKTADKKTIKTKYKQMAKTYHPDLGGNIDDFKKLNTNYDLLREQIGFSLFLGDYVNF